MRLMILCGLFVALVPMNVAGAADMSRGANGCEGARAAVVMRRIAAHAATDPQGLWSDSELWSPNTPDGTDIWSGEVGLCDGTSLVVTQIVNRQCSSPTVCPARVVRRNGAQMATALDYKQICMDHRRISVTRDGGWLSACDIDHRLTR